MNIKQDLLTPNHYSRPQILLKAVKGVVVHWYANPNTTAKQNRDFFENRKYGKTDYGSAHYLIGLEGEIIQAIPENEMAYHVGAKTYTEKALKKYSNYPNNCLLGIENAHIDWNGEMTDLTYNSLINLSIDILKRYNLDETKLELHYDITGKDCHKWFVDNPKEWEIFKQKVKEKLNANTK